MAKPGTPWARPGEVFDTSLGWRFTNPRFAEMDNAVPVGAGPEVAKMTLTMGETAEEVAALDGITREESDAFALRSYARAVAAQEAGRFVKEIVPIATKNGVVDTDEGSRRETTIEKLAVYGRSSARTA